MIDPLDMTRQRDISNDLEYKNLLVPIFRQGEKVYPTPTIQQIRANVQNELNDFHSGIQRFVNPHQYPVGIEKSLYDLKTKLILQIRENYRQD